MLGDTIRKALGGGGDAAGLADAIKDALTNSPTALQRAAALWVWKRSWEAQNPDRPNHGGARKGAAYRETIKSRTSAFEVEARKVTGLGLTTIKDDVNLANALGEDHILVLLGTKVEDNGRALWTISRLEPHQRVSLFGVWEKNDTLELAEALRQAGIHKVKGTRSGQTETLVDAWARSDTAAQRDFAIAKARPLIKFLTEAGFLPSMSGAGSK